MTMNAPGMQLLSDAELDQLSERLDRIRNADALTLEGVDGLFCALIASPESMSPSEYLPVILGGDPGSSQVFADLEDANATMSVLMRYWNSIIADFEQESIHLPFIVEPGIDGIRGRAWARGFLKGTRLAPEGWSDLWDSEGDGQLLSIPLVAGELDPTWPTEALTKEKEDELLRWMLAGRPVRIAILRMLGASSRMLCATTRSRKKKSTTITPRRMFGRSRRSGVTSRARVEAAKNIRSAVGRQNPGRRTEMQAQSLGAHMELDTDKIDQAALALLALGRHEGYRAWKAFDWEVMGRLHVKGYITDPVGKAKSVLFTEDGARESERLLQALFCRSPDRGSP